MDAEPNFFNWIITSIIGLGGAAISYLMSRSINQLDERHKSHEERFQLVDEKLEHHSEQHAHCTLELSNFKTHVSENYAKETNMQQSLARIHDRIDTGFEELRTDIKTILTKIK